MKFKTLIVIITSALLASLAMFSYAQSIQLDGNKLGRVFEGVGAVSAGASSRLLIDYPEPQRSQILDFLFKPDYGAEIQHLKVEIGGDVNSTDGVEPSHMHTRNDYNCTRGYEWWLMKEARQRNPHILLDTLAWGAPAWIGNGTYYSQDMANYVVKFLQGAKKYYGLDINYTGCWNERPYNAEWLILLRKTLDENGLRSVKISAPDNFDWSIINVMEKNSALRNAVYAVGEHYMNSKTTETARKSGIPLWSSEDTGGQQGGDCTEALNTVKLVNHNYILGKITKTEIWSPITSYYSVLPAPNSGIMTANTPWSGHYVVPPTVWAVAQITQFAQPGWRFLAGDGCAILDGVGSYVTLKAPNSDNYSIVLETSSATTPHTLTFHIAGGLSERVLHVWRTNRESQFQHIADITPHDGEFTLTADGQSIYSLTTTTGQHKGATRIPPDHSLPNPYRDDFSSYPVGGMARYFTDQSGVFEVVKRSNGNGNALRQIMTHHGIEWMGEFDPYTIMGDVNWQDYDVSVDAKIEKAGHVALFGHFMQAHWNGQTPSAVWLTVTDSGKWELHSGKSIIASGDIPYSANTWHRLRLSFKGTHVIANVDDHKLCDVTDSTYSAGLAGFGSGWNNADFTNFEVKYAPIPLNLALNKRAIASSQWSPDYAAKYAVDGDISTRWNSADGTSAGEWLEVDFGKRTTFNRVCLHQFDNRILKYKIQYWSDNAWKDTYVGGAMGDTATDTFPAVTSNKIRLLVEQTRDNISPSIYEFIVNYVKNE